MIKFFRKILSSNKQSSEKVLLSECSIETKQSPISICFEEVKCELWNNFEARAILATENEPILNEDLRAYHWKGSIDYSGYTREKSLKYLINNFSLNDENRILLRLCDWVPKIQSLAFDWVKENLHHQPLESFVENADLFIYLSRKEMLKESKILTFIEDLLNKLFSSISPKLFFTLPVNFRKYLIQISLKKDCKLRSLIQSDPEPFNRLQLLFFLGDRLTQQEFSNFKIDKSIFVRRAFLKFRLESNSQLSQKELVELSLDSNRGLRSFAQFYLKQNFEIDAYSFYKIEENIGFCYFADYAKKEDLQLLIKSTELKDRKAFELCVHAIEKIDSSRLREIDLERLLTSKKSRAILLRNLNYLFSFDEILCLVDQGILRFKDAVIGLKSICLWDTFNLVLLKLKNDNSPELYTLANALLSETNYRFERMSNEQAENILKNLESLNGMEVSEDFITYVTFVVKAQVKK